MIFSTKLIPPQVPVHTILRRRLFDRFQAGLHQRMTLLVAGGGWGKSVLLSSFLETHDFPFVWYSLDHTDNDPIRFLGHIAEGLRKRTGRVGQRTLQEITAIGEGGDWRFIFATLLNEVLDGITERYLLVLDDYQVLDTDKRMKEVVASLLRLSLPTIHVILSSREQPNLSLNRYRAHGEVSELGPEDLRFTCEETRELFRTIYAVDLSSHELEALQKRTEGWVIGLRLIGEALAGKAPGETASLPAIEGLEGVAFRYFDEEAFQKMPEAVRAFLKATSIPHRFTPSLAQQLTGRDDSGQVIAALLRKELFLSRLDAEGKWYRYHHLFREFLQNRLQAEDDRQTVVDLHRRAAHYFQDEGEEDEVVYHALRIDDYETAAAVIEKRIGYTFSSNFAQSLRHWLARIPEEEISSHGGLLFGKGWANYVNGQWRLAMPYLAAAMDMAARQGDRDLLAKAVYFILVMHISWEQFQEVEKQVEHTLEFLPLDSPEMMQSAVMYAIALMFRNKPAQARKVWDGLLHHPLAREHRVAYYTALAGMGYMYYLPLGKFPEAAGQIEEGLALAGTQDPSGVRGMFLYFLSDVWHEMGLYEAVPSLAAEAAAEMRKRGLVFTLPSVLALAAVNDICAGAFDRARQALKEADEILASTDVRHVWRQYHHQTARALLAVCDRDKTAFFRHAGAAVKTAAQNNDPYACYQVACHLAPQYAAYGDTGTARALLTDAVSRMRAFGNPYGEARSRLLLAAVAHAQGELSLAGELLEAALHLGEKNEYDLLFLRKESEIAAKVLPFALASGIRNPYVSRLLAKMPQCGEQVLALIRDADQEVRKAAAGVIADMAYRAAERELVVMIKDPIREVRRAAKDAIARLRSLPPLSIRVRMLGEFGVSVGERVVPGSAWKRRMARSLFKYLLLHREGGMSVERLIDALYPEIDPLDAGKRLHQATSALRTVLEPGISPKRESSYLKAGEGSYRLLLPEGSRVDAFEFERLCNEARQSQIDGDLYRAISCYEAAIELYRGDLLQEDVYEDWTNLPRERYAVLYFKALRDLSRLLFDRMEYDHCLEMLARSIEKEPWNEEAALLMMKCYLAIGDRARASKTYQRCCTALKAELALVPGKPLTGLYRILTA